VILTTFSRRDFLKHSSVLLGALLAGCASGTTVTAPVPTTRRATVTATPLPTLDEMIGQMVMVGFRGAVLSQDASIVQDVRARRIGSVVLFDYDVPTKTYGRNIQSPAQLKALCHALQTYAPARLLIAVDQEGGYVARLKERTGFPASVSQQSLGARNDLNVTRAHAETTARTLAEMGINLNLAPVVDLNINPENPIIGKIERSFSADPAIVTEHARAVIRAHHQSGVLTTLKHFPGHGSSRDDSHLGFVDVTATWTRAELEPYARLIATGECDAVMTAHVFNAHLDANFPATLSKPIITGLLREQLGFDGVVISDDLQMKAIANHYGVESAVERALEAGVDILAFANNSIYDETIAARVTALIKQWVQAGKVAPARIEQSYRRVMRLKARLG
jgi:beta-N-acetylhexosaminidase